MLLITLPLYVLAALAGCALVGSPMSFYSSFVQCNPFSKEVFSLPRAGDWDVSAVTMEQHLHFTLSSASSGALQVPPKAWISQGSIQRCLCWPFPAQHHLGHCGNVKWKALPGFIRAAFQTDESFVSQIGKYKTPGVSSHSWCYI